MGLVPIYFLGIRSLHKHNDDDGVTRRDQPNAVVDISCPVAALMAEQLDSPVAEPSTYWAREDGARHDGTLLPPMSLVR